MPNKIDLSGMKFGRLTAISTYPSNGKCTRWICKCECGNTKVVQLGKLRSGNTKSCGCLRRHQGDESVISRFWAKVDKSGGDNVCWLWIPKANPYGYGDFSVRPGKNAIAHRFSWQLQNGPIPKQKNGRTMYVCHACDNRRCVNPRHLFLGTPADNTTDMVEKGRQALGFDRPCTRLSESDVIEIRQSTLPGSVLAERYGVRRSYVYDVRAGRERKHVLR